MSPALPGPADRIARGVANRVAGARAELRVRRQRLHDYTPVPVLSTPRTEVRAASISLVK